MFFWSFGIFLFIGRFAIKKNSSVLWIESFAHTYIDGLFGEKEDKKEAGKLGGQPDTLRQPDDKPQPAKRQHPYRRHCVRAFFVTGLIVLDLFTALKPAIVFWLLASICMLILAIIRSKSGRKYLLLLLMLLIGSIYWVLGPDRELVWRTVFYYLYWLMIGGHLWLQQQRVRDRYKEEARPVAWLFTLSVISGLYYMTTVAFAYGIYPHIPAAKGGGDYFYSPTVEIFFSEQSIKAIPEELIKKSAPKSLILRIFTGEQPQYKSIPLKVIEQTTDTLYIADPDAKDRPLSRWAFWDTPKIFAIRRDTVVSMSTLPTESPPSAAYSFSH